MKVKIEDFEISNESKTFIIAEISANHGHSIDIVKESMKKVKEIGADAVKIKTYTPDTITINCNNEYFKINNGDIDRGCITYYPSKNQLIEKYYNQWFETRNNIN